MLSPEILALKHKGRILGHSSDLVCGFSMMEQVRLCSVWPMENWCGSSLNQIQGWTTVRESYSRALEQEPLIHTRSLSLRGSKGGLSLRVGKESRRRCGWGCRSHSHLKRNSLLGAKARGYCIKEVGRYAGIFLSTLTKDGERMEDLQGRAKYGRYRSL